MRIVIDLQAAQSTSRFRGIGRYSLSLAQAMARNAGKHEILLALNSCFPETIEFIRLAFQDLIPEEQIKIFYTNQPSIEYYLENLNNANISKKLRAYFLRNLSPDIVHISSLFEGLIDDAITSIETYDHSHLTAITLYDLIPLIFSKNYLQHNTICNFYYRKLQELKKANLLLAISASARQEAIDLLSISPDKIINCSSGVNQEFRPLKISENDRYKIEKDYGINKKFILYVGDFDHRKNVQGLIQAFSLLAKDLREKYQLVIVGKANEAIRQTIFSLAKHFYLNKGEIIITGYVSDVNLVILYNLCDLFILPSLHEGFGLPLLEAMACGAVVLASNTSSLPELVGNNDSLFDPTSPSQMAEKITMGLSNEAFRNFIREHSRSQIKKFTWDSSAKKILESYEELEKNNKSKLIMQKPYRCIKNKMAFISPLPPEKTGIANYSMQLLPELACFYDIVIIVEKKLTYNAWLTANFSIQDCNWFIQYAASFDIILYQFGNSYCSYYMFKLIEAYPGIVVLHDFFFSDVLHFLSNTIDEEKYIFLRALYFSHGFSALYYYKKNGANATINRYPCNLSILKNAYGIIVHSQYAIYLAKKWFKLYNPVFIQKIPQLCIKSIMTDRKVARDKLGLSDNDFLICSFGYITSNKLSHRICLSLKDSKFFKKSKIHLVFVGEILVDNYGTQLFNFIKNNKLNQKITITHFVSSELFSTYLRATDLAIQLRTNSRGETSSCIISCLASAIPTIINNHGSSEEFPDETVYKLNENFTDNELEAAMQYLYKNREFRYQLSQNAFNYINKKLHPTKIGEQYKEIINYFTENNPNFLENYLIKDLAKNCIFEPNEVTAAVTATNIANNRPAMGLTQLLIDITTLINVDLKSGIQRVVRGILISLLNNSPSGFRVEPIYLTKEGHYLYAKNYVIHSLELEKELFEDTIVEIKPEDIFLGLDLCLDAIPQAKPILQNWRIRGVKLYFILYDLLPLIRSDFFPNFMKDSFLTWIKTTSEIADGLICISRQVAEEYLTLLKKNTFPFTKLKVGYFYLGSNIEETLPSLGNRMNKDLLQKLSSRQSFLSVGTIEPRKGYMQLINAFSQLWLSNYDVNLVIIGKQGWMVDKIIHEIIKHPEYGQRLIWLKDASDELLREMYSCSTALILPSEGEGFGLPIIEAAQYNLNIIVRDIPVFREVAGDHAFYFKGSEPSKLAQSIEEWLKLRSQGKEPKINDMKYLSWKESTQQLLDIMIPNEKPNKQQTNSAILLE